MWSHKAHKGHKVYVFSLWQIIPKPETRNPQQTRKSPVAIFQFFPGEIALRNKVVFDMMSAVLTK